MTSALTGTSPHLRNIKFIQRALARRKLDRNGTRTYRAGMWIMEYNIEKANFGFTGGDLRKLFVLGQTKDNSWPKKNTT
jgi:hypothetical protein